MINARGAQEAVMFYLPANTLTNPIHMGNDKNASMVH